MKSAEIDICEMSFPTRMIVGPGAISRLGAVMRELDAKRVLLVADRGVVAVGLLEGAEASLDAAGIAHSRFSNISKNPKEQDVLDGVFAYSSFEADAIIGFGGGASLDVAKLISLKVTHALPLSEYDDTKGGSTRIRRTMPAVVAVPTTAGTGSEVGRAAVVSLGDDGRKVVIFSPFMMPKVAICDAELTESMPKVITAATGIDALTHAMEAYVAKGTHPFADGFALGAIARVGLYLPRAVRDGSDIRARHEMMLAASMGAVSFQKGLGACHAMAHPLSAVCDLHHGLANALMLPHVVRENLKRVPERYAIAGRALGAKGSGSDAKQAQACLAQVQALLSDIGLDRSLSDEGVEPSHIEAMVPQAMEDACMPQNPVDFDPATVRRLYEAAL